MRLHCLYGSVGVLCGQGDIQKVLFVSAVCEKAAHTKSSAAPPENNENSDQALNVAANAKLEKAKAAEKKKKADKKAKKKPNQGTTRCSGEFWWA